LALGQVPFGMLADRVGMMKVYATGMILSSITSFFLGFSNEGLIMVIVNFMAGLALSLTAPAEQALVDHNIPESRRTEFNSIIHIMKEVGVVITIVIATILATFFGIDYIFYMQSIIFLIAPIAFFVTYKVAKEN
jgi:MFS family permease